MEMEIGGVQMLMTPGMIQVIPSKTPHSARVIKDSIVIDVFSPVREEYK
jgi:mannose-6-phosphate isomerase-like protein (cupin superfamily)